MNIHFIKIGGRVAADQNILETFLLETAELSKKEHIVLVHGGGAEVSALSKRLGQKPRFLDGVRMTSSEEMPIVDMVLGGKMNKYIVRTAKKMGLNCVGISGCDGSLFTGESIDPAGENRTGRITSVSPSLIDILVHGGFTPAVSSVSMDSEGNPLNINADEAALELAKALNAASLVYISDIPGVLSDNEVIPQLNQKSTEQFIEDGVIKGGMIPKVRSGLEAVSGGVDAVIIGGYIKHGDLKDLLNRERGTAITA